MLKALTQFDREKQKDYSIPVYVCDLKELCAVSNLKLIIGDVNDNPMAPGFSEIFVYNYQGMLKTLRIFLQCKPDKIIFAMRFERLLQFSL